MFNYITENRGKLSNEPFKITEREIHLMLAENSADEEECRRVTASSYRGETYYANDGRPGDEKINDFFLAFAKEVLYRDTKTSGCIMEYPHGIIIRQAERNHFYRGENRIYSESVSSIYRKSNNIKTISECSPDEEAAIHRFIADMRIAEFQNFLSNVRILDAPIEIREDNSNLAISRQRIWRFNQKNKEIDFMKDFGINPFTRLAYYPE